MSVELVVQRVDNLESRVKDLEVEVKELERRVASHDVMIARIELIVESMQSSWVRLEQEIRNAMESQQQSNTLAWKEVTVEAIKTIGIVAGAILAAKLFIK